MGVPSEYAVVCVEKPQIVVEYRRRGLDDGELTTHDVEIVTGPEPTVELVSVQRNVKHNNNNNTRLRTQDTRKRR